MTLEETGSPVSEVLLQCEQARSAISAAWACIADGNRGGAQRVWRRRASISRQSGST